MKVFCDKGAERKFRQEERRAARKVAVGGQRVLEMYHQVKSELKILTANIHQKLAKHIYIALFLTHFDNT